MSEEKKEFCKFGQFWRNWPIKTPELIQCFLATSGIPKRMLIVIMASLATAIQYTIRSNLSVTIVAMVNNTEPLIDQSPNETLKSKIVGCLVPDQFPNTSFKAVQHELKVIDFHAIQLVELLSLLSNSLN